MHVCISTVKLIDNLHITDIDECYFNNGHGGQNCFNTVGSYFCTCNSGYHLHSDKHRCIGMYIHV